jgi:hypothetical protein
MHCNLSAIKILVNRPTVRQQGGHQKDFMSAHMQVATVCNL